MRKTAYAKGITLVLSVTVILAFATTPASAASMQGTEKSEGNVTTPAMSSGSATEMKGDVAGQTKGEMKGKTEASAKRKADMRGTHERGASDQSVKKFERKASVGVVTEPRQDVFYEGEAGAAAERDRRFSGASRFALRFTEFDAAELPAPQPGVFYNGEAGATAERDRRASNVTRAEQRGLILPEETPRIIVSGEASVEWYEPWAEAAGAGSGWGQPARAGSMVSRQQRAVAPVYNYDVGPYPYDYWFAPISGEATP